MPVEDRFVPRFAAEPPQDLLPYGRWAQALQEEFLAACLRDRQRGRGCSATSARSSGSPTAPGTGARSCPASRRTANGFELYGYVSYAPGGDGEEPADFHARRRLHRRDRRGEPRLGSIDLCDEVIGTWRGEQGKVAAMTLVWGRPMVDGGAVATAELADLAVDQCILVEGRFTLIAPDDYRGDTLDVKLFDAPRRGARRASRSTSDDEDED